MARMRIGEPKLDFVKPQIQLASINGYRLMMSYIKPMATACCAVATRAFAWRSQYERPRSAG